MPARMKAEKMWAVVNQSGRIVRNAWTEEPAVYRKKTAAEDDVADSGSRDYWRVVRVLVSPIGRQPKKVRKGGSR